MTHSDLTVQPTPFKNESVYHTDKNCIFCNIVNKKIPAKIIYEDQDIIAFNDIKPIATVHFLIIPKIHIESLSNVDANNQAHLSMITRILTLAPKLAALQGCKQGREGGFKLLTNNGLDGGQEVFHLHFHVIGGSRF